MRYIAIFILFCTLVGIDAEFANYSLGGGLLNGSLVSILFFTGVVIIFNCFLILGMYNIAKYKEIFK